MKRGFGRVAICAALALAVLGATPTLAAKIGLVSSDKTTNNVVKNFLVSTGQFADSDITYIQTSATWGGSTPTLATLKQYDALLVWTNWNPVDPTALGNVLADYVDAGGGVVISPFASSRAVASVGGKFATADYNPFVSSGAISSAAVNLGTIVEPTSPIMDGVTTLSTSKRDNVTVASGATVLANWQDGVVAVALGKNNRVVGINTYPGETTLLNDPKTSVVYPSGDYARLYANALTFAATPAPVPEPSTMLAGGTILAGIPCFFRRRRRK
jgi:hypothetical protein